MIALASRQELQTRKPRSAPTLHILTKEEYLNPDPFLQPYAFPLACEKTQCVFCIGNERLSYKDRTRAFRRVSHMMDHVEDLHFSKLSVGQIMTCYHPVCKAEGLVLTGVTHFKDHVAKVHGISLRP